MSPTQKTVCRNFHYFQQVNKIFLGAVLILWSRQATWAQGASEPVLFQNDPEELAIKPILGMIILFLALFCLLKPVVMRLLTRHHEL